MGLTLATKERWESQMQQMKDNGQAVNEDLSYEEMLDFYTRGEYQINLAREYHIDLEFSGVDAILPYLHDRKWMVFKATKESGPFITSDNPVSLTWNDPESVPPIYRSSPGHGMAGTQLCFAVSKNTLLLGEFEGRQGAFDASIDFVAMINAQVAINSRRQIYAPRLQFPLWTKDEGVQDGRYLLNKK